MSLKPLLELKWALLYPSQLGRAEFMALLSHPQLSSLGGAYGSCHSYIIRNGDSDLPKMLNYAKKLCLQKQRNDHLRMHSTQNVKILDVSTRTYFTAQGTVFNTFNTLGLPMWLRW